MKITEGVVRFHPYMGGVEQTVYQLGRRLADRGHEITVVCSDEGGGPDEVEGMDVRRLPWLLKISNTNISPGIVSTIADSAPSAIHTHIPTAWHADCAAVAARRLRVPLILTYHNDIHGTGVKGPIAAIYNRFFLPRLLRRCSRIVVSHSEYAHSSPHLAAFRDRVSAIPWGVDVTRFPATPLPGGDELQVGFLSILDNQHGYKGLALLLCAVRDGLSRGLSIRLHVGGEGPCRRMYEGRARELGIAEHVSWHGYIPDPDLPAFYAAMHLFALPSLDARQEGFGLVLLEAMACGRPLLTTNVVGIASDLVGEGPGWAVPPGNVEALATRLAEAHDDRETLARMGKTGAQIAREQYTWERVADDYENLFLSVLHGSRERRSNRR